MNRREEMRWDENGNGEDEMLAWRADALGSPFLPHSPRRRRPVPHPLQSPAPLVQAWADRNSMVRMWESERGERERVRETHRERGFAHGPPFTGPKMRRYFQAWKKLNARSTIYNLQIKILFSDENLRTIELWESAPETRSVLWKIKEWPPQQQQLSGLLSDRRLSSDERRRRRRRCAPPPLLPAFLHSDLPLLVAFSGNLTSMCSLSWLWN